MECGRDSALTSKHPGPLRPNKYATPSHTGRGAQVEGLAWSWFCCDPRVLLTPFVWGGSERKSSELLAWASE